MERVEVHLLSHGSTAVINETPLPIGSTLDKQKGIFYWQPGIAYKGVFPLSFVLLQKMENQLKKRLI